MILGYRLYGWCSASQLEWRAIQIAGQCSCWLTFRALDYVGDSITPTYHRRIFLNLMKAASLLTFCDISGNSWLLWVSRNCFDGQWRWDSGSHQLVYWFNAKRFYRPEGKEQPFESLREGHRDPYLPLTFQ